VISVLILTRNEQSDLPGCLDSVRWSDDIHVFDSYSSDRTVEIARAAGTSVTQREFDNWSSHQNWGLANIRFRHRWVLYIDADERVTPELARSLQTAASRPGENVAFRVSRRDFWGDCWLKHVQATSFYIRLFRPEKMRYERLVNPVSIVHGPVGEVGGYLDHYPFSKGLTHWLARHNSYSSFESEQILRDRAGKRTLSLRSALLAKDASERRFHQKELFYRVPCRPILKFVHRYIGNRGFLDGRGGLRYALLQSFYEYMIVLKTEELMKCQVSPTRAGSPAPQLGQVTTSELAANHASEN
jgi:glycosyltransferase involved in cell wall biosynthesis